VTTALDMILAHWREDRAVRAHFGTPPRIHDAAPQHAAYPYASVAAWRTRPWNAGGVPGEEIAAEIAVFSRRSRPQALKGADALARAIDGHQSADGMLHLAGVFVMGTDCMLEKDRATWRATLKLKLLTHLSIPSPLEGEGED
jgi:hypothetical protein